MHQAALLNQIGQSDVETGSSPSSSVLFTSEKKPQPDAASIQADAAT